LDILEKNVRVIFLRTSPTYRQSQPDEGESNGEHRFCFELHSPQAAGERARRAPARQTYTPPSGDPLNVVDVRMFAMDKKGTNVATAKGVSMSVRRLRDLHEAVTKALAKAESLGLIDSDEAAP
jgi:hypothetical protein